MRALSKSTIRWLLENDLGNGGPIVLRAVVVTKHLLLSCPCVERGGGSVDFVGQRAEEIVFEAVDQLLRGERRVFSLRGGLLVTVTDLVRNGHDASAPSGILDKVHRLLRGRGGAGLSFVLLRLLGPDPDLRRIAVGVLAGKRKFQIARELGLGVDVVAARMRQIKAIADRVTKAERQEPVA